MGTFKRINPYKGLEPYNESDKKKFYGRDEEKKKLTSLVKDNFLTLVFGKSGIGKTSLLQAGVFPNLKDNGFTPIRIRLNFDKSLSLNKQIRDIINKEFQNHNIIAYNDSGSKNLLSENESLWEYFHRVNHFFINVDNKRIETTPVLVWDQFEEFSTIGLSHPKHEEIIEELYYLIEDEFPEKLTLQLIQKNEQFPFANRNMNLRIIISIRQDYLHYIYSIKNQIPSIDKVMFQVSPLNKEQAKEIISMPGGIQGPKNRNDILSLLLPPDYHERITVEPFLLSLICFQYFNKNTLHSFNYRNKDIILKEFYKDTISHYSKKTKDFIEDKLITENGERILFPFPSNPLLEKELNDLILSRILREEIREGNTYIELVHDVLADIVKTQRQKQELKKKFGKLIILSALFIFIGILVLLFITINQYKSSEINRLGAEALLEFPKDNTKAMSIAGIAYQKAQPNPPARIAQIISEIGYSSFKKPFYETILQHQGPVKNAMISEDGAKLISASNDKTASIWDITGNKIATLQHKGKVTWATLSFDGNYALTTSRDRTAKLWDLKKKNFLEIKHPGIVNIGVFSGDNRYTFTSSNDGTTIIYDIDGEQKYIIKNMHRSRISGVAFSKTGGYLVTSAWDRKTKIWKINSLLKNRSSKNMNPQPYKILPHDGAVLSLDLSPNSGTIVTASSKGIIYFWNLGREKISSAITNLEGLKLVMFSTDGNGLIGLFEGGIIKFLTLEGKKLKEFQYNLDINSIYPSSDGQKLLIACEDGTARLINIYPELVIEFPESLLNKSTVDSPLGIKQIIESFPKDILQSLYKRSDVMRKNLFFPQETDEPVSWLSPDGNRKLIPGEGGEANLWDEKGVFVTSLRGFRSQIIHALFSYDNKSLLIFDDKKEISLWNSHGKLIKKTIIGTEITKFLFSPDNKYFLTASKNGTIRVWTNKSKPVIELEGHKDEITSIVISKDNEKILSASKDRTVKLWSLKRGLLADLTGFDSDIKTIAFNKNEKMILTSTIGGSIKVWYTPFKIYHWLKGSNIAPLPQKELEKLGVK